MSDMFVRKASTVAVPLTVRKRATANVIEAVLQGRIDRLAKHDQKFRGCRAPRPRPSRTRADSAPNWTVDGFPGLPSGGFARMVQILDQARMEYELVE